MTRYPEIECPTCDGEGSYTVAVGGSGDHDYNETCEECHGCGHVTDYLSMPAAEFAAPDFGLVR